MALRRVAVARAAIVGRARRAGQVAQGAATGAYRTRMHRAFPVVDGTLLVRGPAGRVTVIRDRYGVPHVFAGSIEDAFFGQGVVHAQDRLFQMDGARRLAAGRLAELGGVRLLQSDRFMRRVGLAHVAREGVIALDSHHRGLLEAYAEGVNEGMRTLPALPPEFALIGYEPEPWRVEDTTLIGLLVLFGFALNWDTELQRERLAFGLGAEQAAALDPVHPSMETVTALPYLGAGEWAAADRLLEAYGSTVRAGLPVGGMSNAWAVSGARTRSGAPLLASDPHVPATMPGLFHVCHVHGGGLDAIGADIPGIPAIAIGHNQRLAWGITAGMANVADCYIEEFTQGSPRRYRTPDGWAEAEERVERIEVRNGRPVEERVLITRHGPVLSPVIPGETRAVAMRSTVLEQGDLVGGFVGVSLAQDVETFEAAADAWSGTTFNIVFAHVDGQIGYRMVGSVPRARVGEGLLPRDGATSPGPPPPFSPRELPRVVDPPSGIVVSANQAPGGELELGEEWAEPKRAERITTLLHAEERHSAASCVRIQVDRYSDHLVQLRDLLVACGAVAEPEGPLLAAWDGVLSPRDPGAAVIGATYEELARRLADRTAGRWSEIVLGVGLGGVNPYSSFLYRLQGSVIGATLRAAPPWYDGVADRDRQLVGAVARAVERLQARFGADPARWRWGALHPLALDHPMRNVPAVGRWFSRGLAEFGGDVNTVWQAACWMHVPDAETRVTAAYRQVIDLADFDRSTFMLLSGNSGVPGHPRYDDCIPEYLAGRQRPLLYSRPAIEAAAESWLTLEPAEPDPNGAGA